MYTYLHTVEQLTFVFYLLLIKKTFFKQIWNAKYKWNNDM